MVIAMPGPCMFCESGYNHSRSYNERLDIANASPGLFVLKECFDLLSLDIRSQ